MKLFIEGYVMPDFKNRKTAEEANETCAYVYAHGWLEAMSGYDIVCYKERTKFDYATDRIENVIAVLPNGIQVNSTLFFWHDNDFYDDVHWQYAKCRPWFNCHGLLVANFDKEALQYARKVYNKKQPHI